MQVYEDVFSGVEGCDGAVRSVVALSGGFKRGFERAACGGIAWEAM
jgi:hypothetical protein